MNGDWTLITPPTSEPVSIEETKDHLRVDGDVEDALIGLYVQMAREAVEHETWRAFLPQTWDLALDAWPESGAIELPRPPLQSVTSITYRDSALATHTLATTAYRVDTAAEPGRVVLAPGAAWPSDELDTGKPIRVRFVAGYASAADVPAMARAAILLQVAEIYANREAAITGTIVAVSPAVQRVLNLLRVRY